MGCFGHVPKFKMSDKYCNLTALHYKWIKIA